METEVEDDLAAALVDDKTATLPLPDARLDAIEMVARGKGEAEKLK
jgi:hypothetical protein